MRQIEVSSSFPIVAPIRGSTRPQNNVFSSKFSDEVFKIYKIGKSKNLESRLKDYKIKIILFTIKTDDCNNLENKFPEFKDVMEEYRDGLLLFDLMEKEIWEKSKNDTIGLENFYSRLFS